MPDLILAHDIGTTGNKATLYCVDGSLVASSTSDYATHFFNTTWAEQDPEEWWRAVVETTHEVVEGIDAARIGALSFSGQMMGCVCVDRNGMPLRPAIIWADQRATKEVNGLLATLPLDKGYQITGHRISPSYSLAKLLWVREHEPDTFRNTHKALQAKDLIVHRLTGAWTTDHSDASGTNALDLETLEWSPRVLEAAELDRAILPDVGPSVGVVGTLTRGAAETTGLKEGTPVVRGAGDGMCAAVGAGCVSPGSVYSYLGSSAWIAMASNSPLGDPEMKTFTWAHAVPGLYSPCGTAQAIGASFSWLHDTVCLSEQAEAGNGRIEPDLVSASSHDLINKQIEQSPVGANGLLFLPYLLGERSPWWNPDARGAFVGLKMEHTRADLLRSVVEGVFLNLRLILEVLRPSITADRMDVIGGFARGDVQRRIMADVFGTPIAVPDNLVEATSMGAAIIGGVGTGLLEGFEAVQRFRKVVAVTGPDRAAHERYTEMLGIFEKCYHDLSPTYGRLAEL